MLAYLSLSNVQCLFSTPWWIVTPLSHFGSASNILSLVLRTSWSISENPSNVILFLFFLPVSRLWISSSFLSRTLCSLPPTRSPLLTSPGFICSVSQTAACQHPHNQLFLPRVSSPLIQMWFRCAFQRYQFSFLCRAYIFVEQFPFFIVHVCKMPHGFVTRDK